MPMYYLATRFMGIFMFRLLLGSYTCTHDIIAGNRKLHYM